MTERLSDLIGNVPVRFWTCLQGDHKNVTWTGDVATCDTCGLTSEDTNRYRRVVVEVTRERLAQAIGDIRYVDQPEPVELIPPGEAEITVEYGVRHFDGTVKVFGDQEWVRSGQALEDEPNAVAVVQRTVTTTRSEWVVADDA